MSSTQTSTLQPIPFIVFNGNCAEVMHHYAEVFGAKINVMMLASQSPIADQLPPGFEDKVLNAQLELPGGLMIYAGDCPPHMTYEGIKGMGIALNFDTEAAAEEIFNLLSDGGKVNMPFGPTFWAKKFGMVTDKFGVDWMINGELIIM